MSDLDKTQFIIFVARLLSFEEKDVSSANNLNNNTKIGKLVDNPIEYTSSLMENNYCSLDRIF